MSTPKMFAGEDATITLDTMIQEGINTFDTARGYGRSENSLGNWIEKRSNRKDINIITKCGYISVPPNVQITPELINREISESLSCLKTDYIDIYLLHKDDKVSDVGPIIDTLNELKENGKIGIFGASNWTWQRMEKAMEYAYKNGLEGFSVSEQAYSFIEQIEDPYDSICLAGEKNTRERSWYINNRMPVFAYSSLARGFLSGKIKSTDSIEKAQELFDEKFIREYFHPENMKRLSRLEQMAEIKKVSIAELALAYCLHSQMEIFPLMSPSPSRVASNVKALELQLTEKEYAYLEAGED